MLVAHLLELVSASETDVMFMQDHTLQGDPVIACKYTKSQGGTITCLKVDPGRAGQGRGNQKRSECNDCLLQVDRKLWRVKACMHAVGI